MLGATVNDKTNHHTLTARRNWLSTLHRRRNPKITDISATSYEAATSLRRQEQHCHLNTVASPFQNKTLRESTCGHVIRLPPYTVVKTRKLLE